MKLQRQPEVPDGLAGCSRNVPGLRPSPASSTHSMTRVARHVPSPSWSAAGPVGGSSSGLAGTINSGFKRYLSHAVVLCSSPVHRMGVLGAGVAGRSLSVGSFGRARPPRPRGYRGGQQSIRLSCGQRGVHRVHWNTRRRHDSRLALRVDSVPASLGSAWVRRLGGALRCRGRRVLRRLDAHHIA
jgi:hypothetical protein